MFFHVVTLHIHCTYRALLNYLRLNDPLWSTMWSPHLGAVHKLKHNMTLLGKTLPRPLFLVVLGIAHHILLYSKQLEMQIKYNDIWSVLY